MSALIREYLEKHRDSIEKTLRECLPASRFAGARKLNSAIEFAVFSGGRRMRPVLALLSAEICGGDPHRAMRSCAAIEFVHAASLVIDDLPCMDDAGLRRGSATVHVLFGADMAVLAALALLNQSYALFAETPGLLSRAVREIGANHMIGGQALDLCGNKSRDRMEKTTALTRLTMAAGAASAGADEADTAALIAFGNDLGEAYQICDDLADVSSPESVPAKTVGQDGRHGRASAVEIFGTDGAREVAGRLIDRACRQLTNHFGLSRYADLLTAHAESVVARHVAGAK